MSKTDFESQKDLRAWLKTQPFDVSVAIAARAAIRAIVIAFPRLGANDVQQRAEVVLPVLRSMAASWVAAQYIPHSVDFADASVSPAMDVAARTLGATSYAANAAAYAARTARVAHADRDRAVDFAAKTVESANDAIANTSEN